MMLEQPATKITPTLFIGVSHSVGSLLDTVTSAEYPVNLFQSNTAQFSDEQTSPYITHLPPSNLYASPIAVDGLIVIAHPDAPLENITVEQLQQLYHGVFAWDTFGGDGEIRLLMREDGSAIRALFTERVMGGSQMSQSAEIRYTPEKIIEEVAQDPQAIGIVTRASLPINVAVKLIAIDNIVATPQTLQTQQYPLSAPIYWVSNEEPLGRERAYLSWLQNDAQSEIGKIVGRVQE